MKRNDLRDTFGINVEKIILNLLDENFKGTHDQV